jgi:beta-ribofuranosylaminobenzene 5'-phosphate synthase
MTSIRIEAPARLHLGMFDLSGTLGRRFGGIGVAVEKPAVVLNASLSNTLTAHGPGSERALEFARCYLRATGIPASAHLEIKQVIPSHVGLGSGTKLALAVARVLADLYNQPTDPVSLAQAVGRGARSAIGLWTFDRGGLVVEGGRRMERDEPAPLLLQYPMPQAWRCVLAIPDSDPGLSGTAEVDAFKQLHPSSDQAAQIAHLVLMALLPALVEQDIAEFGAALTQIQRLVGDCFSPAQGGQFANASSSELIHAMLEWGAVGAGQSSWGPTVYGLAADEHQGRQLAARAEELLGSQGRVELVAFDNAGVRVAKYVGT